MASTEIPGKDLTAYRLPALSGVLLGTSYIPFPPWALFFCLVPLWIFWLREGSWKRILLGGWIAQFVFTLITAHWVAYTAHEFGHLSWPVAIAVLLLFGAAAHQFIPLAGLAWSSLCAGGNLPRWAKLGLLPAITALFWHLFPMIFPWHLGYAWLWGKLPAYQLAEFIGFSGLAALTLFLNLAFLLAWENRKSPAGLRILAGTLAFLLGINALGWVRGRSLPPPDASVRALVVQGNIGNPVKERAERGEGFREEILGRYFTLTERGWTAPGSRPDFAVWPESAFPDLIVPGRTGHGNAGLLRAFLRSRSIPLMTGARGTDRKSGKRTNSFAVFDERGEMPAAPYDKSILLAFGEYVPGAGTFPGIARWFPHTADFARGGGPRVMAFRGLAVGPQICYEGLFPGFSRELADQGAQIFVNVTNDSWFGTWAEPYQHLAMTLARGIEFRRPVIRSTNTGISTVMLADGTILERSPLHREWFHTYEIPFRKDPPVTFYQQHGCRIVPALLLLAPPGILLFSRRRRV